MRIHVRRTDALWASKQDLVYAEIADIMGIESASSMTQGWFGHRMTAMRHILDRMSQEELDQLEIVRRSMSENGLPADVRAA